MGDRGLQEKIEAEVEALIGCKSLKELVGQIREQARFVERGGNIKILHTSLHMRITGLAHALCAFMHLQVCTCLLHVSARPHTYEHVCNIGAHARRHAHGRSHAHARAHTHAHTHARTHARARACTPIMHSLRQSGNWEDDQCKADSKVSQGVWDPAA